MVLIRTRKDFAIYIFLASCCPIQEILFEGQKETMKIPGAEGDKTGIC
jgi:hypothetical protein